MSAPGPRKSEIERAPEKPVPLTVDPTQIPASIKDPNQWVCWRYERRKNKWTKPLLDPKTGKMAKSTDPSSWGTFQQALKLYQDRRLDGVGFVLAPPYAGIDLDDARDPESGTIADWALEIIGPINSYAEISPSGTGVKIFLKGESQEINAGFPAAEEKLKFTIATAISRSPDTTFPKHQPLSRTGKGLSNNSIETCGRI